MVKKKCENCNKLYVDYKLISCKCSKMICCNCKYSHNCNYDYYTNNKEYLKKHLPEVRAKKI